MTFDRRTATIVGEWAAVAALCVAAAVLWGFLALAVVAAAFLLGGAYGQL